VNFRFLDDDVLVLVADVGQVATGEVPGLNAVRQEHARRSTAQEEMLLETRRRKIIYGKDTKH